MRILLTLSLSLLLGVSAIAQPILGPATLPTPSRSVLYLLADTTGVRPGDGGVDVVWDFTFLQHQAEGPQALLQATVTPGELPQEIRDQFPTADRAIVRDTLTELFQVSGFTMRIVGVVTSSVTIQFAESDPYDVRPVELRFGAEHLDTHSATITPNSIPTVLNRRGEHRLVYDGWGQLLLPVWGPLQAARVSMQRRTTDTLALGLDTAVITTELDRTYWADPESDRVYLVMHTERISRTFNGEPLPDTITQRHVRWLDSTATTSVHEVGTGDQLQIRPHPVSGGSFTILCLTAEPSRVRLWSLDGRQTDLSDGLLPLNDRALITLPEVQPGLYILELDMTQRFGTKRIVRKAVVITR